MASPSPATAPTSSTPASHPTPPPARFRVGEMRNVGTVRKESVDADRWDAHGTVKVTGDANVGEGTLDGNVHIGGKVAANTLHYRGTFEVDGAMDVGGAITGSGAFRAGLTFHAGEADLKGTVRVLGATMLDRSLTVRGRLEAPSVTVDALDLEGEAHVAGDLVGRSVSAHLTDDSVFGTIRARSVILRAKVPNLVEKMLWRHVTVTAQRVEADAVHLEAVDVKFVRSPQITLGRGAHITEYEGTIVRRHPSSRVGFESKSPPPYGLSR